MKLIDKIVQGILKEKIDLKSKKLLLAVSGGKDSMVLLDVLYQLKVNFVVAHVNYQLRESDSELDEVLVIETCENLKIPYFTKKVDTKLYCKAHQVSTQEGARILRYSWFEELIQDNQLDWITTAHHEEDNKETFIQNLKRGSGLRGLKSMLMLQNNRFKPMLKISRKEIDAYSTEKSIVYREDASNNQNHYQRNLIRNEFLPQAEKILEGFGNGLSQSILKLQTDYEYIQHALQKEKESVCTFEGKDCIIKNFKNLHKRLLFYILETYDFNIFQMEDMISASQTGKTIENEKFGAVFHQSDLIIYPITKNELINELITKEGTYSFLDFDLIISETEKPQTFSQDLNYIYVDADSISFPLTIRNWKDGDKFSPLGMNGSKKISDFLTDLKMPLHQKNHVKLLISKGKIIWIINHALGDFFKIKNSTKKVLKIETISKKLT